MFHHLRLNTLSGVINTQWISGLICFSSLRLINSLEQLKLAQQSMCQSFVITAFTACTYNPVWPGAVWRHSSSHTPCTAWTHTANNGSSATAWENSPRYISDMCYCTQSQLVVAACIVTRILHFMPACVHLSCVFAYTPLSKPCIAQSLSVLQLLAVYIWVHSYLKLEWRREGGYELKKGGGNTTTSLPRRSCA